MAEERGDAREIFLTPEVMSRIGVIETFEEGRYSDIPKWDGLILDWTPKAVLLYFTKIDRRSAQNWFPFSQLRKAGDGQSIYASNWIIDQKGL